MAELITEKGYELGVVALKIVDESSGNVVLTLPTSDGTDGQVIATDGSGALTFTNPSSGGATLTGSTNNTITTVTGANAFQGESNLTFDGTTLAVTGNQTVSGTLAVTGTVTAGAITSVSISGTSGSVIVSDNTQNIDFPVVFHDESYTLHDDTGALEYNPSTGTLLAPVLTVAGTLDVAGAVTFNDAGADVDFRVESDGNANMLVVDGGENKVGIGTAPVSWPLEVQGEISATSTIYSGTMFQTTGARYWSFRKAGNDMQIYSGQNGAIPFEIDGDTSDRIKISSSAYIAQQALTSSSQVIAWDVAAKQNCYHLTTENTTFSAPTNAVEGAIITIEIAQGGTARTIAWNTVFEWAASTTPTITATANKTDIFTFRYNGSVWQEIGRVQNMAQT